MKTFSNVNNSLTSASVNTQKLPNNQENLPISDSLSDNLNKFHELFSNCIDVVYREFYLDAFKCSAVLIFISVLVDITLINDSIMPSLMNIKEAPTNNLKPGQGTEIAKKQFLQFANIDEILTFGEAVDALLNGYTVFLLDGDTKALGMSTPGFKERDVTEPTIERILRGPKEGFTENITTNVSLLRRKIRSSELKIEEQIFGRQTRTKINIAYLQGIVDENIVKEVKERIGRIDVDAILDSGYIEELIEDTSYTVFPQVQQTERPDKAAAAILEGRVVILVDGTPFVLIVPATFIQFFQSSDEYYERFTAATALRLIRFIFLGISLLLPGLYVAIILYHKEMIPTNLLISILGAAHGVPFPIFIEVLIMELCFEAIREAGIHLPGPAGQTVGIVGVLIIGESAVRAGVVSSITTIVVATTAIASFGVPSYPMGYAIRILRFVMLALGSLFGLYGIMLGLLVLMIHLASLRSFGINYLSPIAPLSIKDLKDVLVRFPHWAMNERPSTTSINNPRRHKPDLKPKPPNPSSASTKDDKDKKG